MFLVKPRIHVIHEDAKLCRSLEEVKAHIQCRPPISEAEYFHNDGGHLEFKVLLDYVIEHFDDDGRVFAEEVVREDSDVEELLDLGSALGWTSLRT